MLSRLRLLGHNLVSCGPVGGHQFVIRSHRFKSSRSARLFAVRSLLENISELTVQRSSELSNDQFVDVLHLIGYHRVMPKGIPKILENELIKRHGSLTERDLWIGGDAFYRTDTRFDGHRLLNIIVQRTLSSMENGQVETDESDYCGAVMASKLLKLNGRLEHVHLMHQLSRHLVEKPVDTFPIFYWSHFASACRHMRYYDAKLAENLVKKVTLEFGYLREKDVALIVGYLTTIGHPLPEDLRWKIIDLLVRSWSDFPPNLAIRFLFSLSLDDVYPLDLISKVLHDDWLMSFSSRRRSYERFPARAVFWLDSSVAVERPDYSGNRLNLSLFQRPGMAALMENIVPIQCEQPHDVQLYQLSVASEMIRLVVGCDAACVYQGLILPHSPAPGLLLKFVNGLPVPVSITQSLRRVEVKELRVPDGEQWIAVLVHRHGCCRYRSTQLLGNHVAHLRHLEKLGYKVIRVYHKSLPRKPTDAGVKRFEQCLRTVREQPDVSSFIY